MNSRTPIFHRTSTQPLKTRLSILAALGALLGSTGCITSQGTGKDKLPPDWLAAVPKPGAPTADLAGVFVEFGEQLDAKFTRNGTVTRVNLTKVLTPRLLAPRRDFEPGDRGATTELRRADDTHLELITRIEGAVTNRVTVEAEFDRATGAVTLHHGRSTAHLAATGHLAATVRLWRAADGRLYAHVTGRFIGEMMLVPIVSSAELWCRWEPAPLAPPGIPAVVSVATDAPSTRPGFVTQ